MKVLKFYADWCGPCKAYAPIFESAAKSLNFEYENINVDKDTTGLAAEHKVQSIPTTVFIKEDGTIEKKVGLLQESQIKEIIENA
jgi:thioredoxin 1